MDKELLLKYYRCRTSPAEEEAIADWLDASYENAAEYAAFRREMDTVTLAASAIDELYEASRRRGLRRSLRRWSVAAAAALLLGLGASYLTATHVRREAGRLHVWDVAPLDRTFMQKADLALTTDVSAPPAEALLPEYILGGGIRRSTFDTTPS